MAHTPVPLGFQEALTYRKIYLFLSHEICLFPAPPNPHQNLHSFSEHPQTLELILRFFFLSTILVLLAHGSLDVT